MLLPPRNKYLLRNNLRLITFSFIPTQPPILKSLLMIADSLGPHYIVHAKWRERKAFATSLPAAVRDAVSHLPGIHIHRTHIQLPCYFLQFLEAGVAGEEAAGDAVD